MRGARHLPTLLVLAGLGAAGPAAAALPAAGAAPPPSRGPSTGPTGSPSPTEHLPAGATGTEAGGLFAPAPTDGATATAAMPVEVAPALACPPHLSQSAPVDYQSTLRYALVPSAPPGAGNGLLCARLESDNAGGWVSLGFTRTGRMAGSEAVVGVPSAGTVRKYDLFNLTLAGVVPMAEARQTLRDARVSVEEDGRVVMEFARLLTEDGEVALREAGSNFFLHARGSGGELGYHDNGYGSFWRDFAEDVYEEEEEEEEEEKADEEEVIEEEEPLEEEEPSTQVCNSLREMCAVALDPDYLLRYRLNVPSGASLTDCIGCSVAVELVHEGEAWVALAFSRDGRMIGGEAVIGIPGEGVLKYTMGSKTLAGVAPMPDSQQTLLDTSIEVKDGQTIMKFVKVLKESGEIEIMADGDNYFLGAYGFQVALSIHVARQTVVLNLSSGAAAEVALPNKAAWLVHGILAFVAWGMCVPFAVQASIFRKLLPRGPLWFKLHKQLNLGANVLTVLLCALAAVMTGREGGPHLANGHQRLGLALLLLASAQVLGGLFRPPTPAPGAAPTPARRGWGVGHRALGASLLAAAFWQMASGVALYANKYAVDEGAAAQLLVAYWVWIGGVAAAIVLGPVYFRYRRAPAAEGTKQEKGDEEKGGASPLEDTGNTAETKHDEGVANKRAEAEERVAVESTIELTTLPATRPAEAVADSGTEDDKEGLGNKKIGDGEAVIDSTIHSPRPGPREKRKMAEEVEDGNNTVDDSGEVVVNSTVEPTNLSQPGPAGKVEDGDALADDV